MNKRVNCEIIVIGNEILSGFVKETNSHMLIDRLTRLGGKINRITCIEDDVSVISKEIRNVFKRKVKFIVCSGGLGPTDDDVTLEGISKGLNLQLFQNREALIMIEERYKKLFEEGKTFVTELTPERIKMSHLPYRAIPLFNGVGTAPGVLIECKGKYVVSLPGVPEELKFIFENSLKPYLQEIFPVGIERIERNIFLDITDESLIAKKLKEARNFFKNLYIKSKPGKEENLFKVEVVIHGIGESEEIQKRVEEAIEFFKSNLGGTCEKC